MITSQQHEDAAFEPCLVITYMTILGWHGFFPWLFSVPIALVRGRRHALASQPPNPERPADTPVDHPIPSPEDPPIDKPSDPVTVPGVMPLPH